MTHPTDDEHTYLHPGYKKPYPIETVLRDLAAQEGCDGEPYDAMVFAADAIAALRAQLAASQTADPVTNADSCQPVKVKPLVWTETLVDRGDGLTEHNGGYEADSALGVYEICMGFGSDCYYWSVTDPNLNDLGSFEDHDYAKAAAQADYEASLKGEA